MNKKIKRIIAMVLALGAFTSFAPNKYFNHLAINAYASDDSGDKYGIDSLQVVKGDYSSDNSDSSDDGTLDMYTSSDYKEHTSFDVSEDQYYVRTSEPTIKMRIDKANGCSYKIFKKGDSNAYSSGDQLDLKAGDNTFYVRTYEKGNFNEKNVEENQITFYIIHVERVTSSSIYLKDISLSDGDISFSKDTTSYDVEEKADVDEITVGAEPVDSGYTVKINDTKVTDNDNFRKKVSLNNGKNTIKIQVGDDADNIKTYTLNVYRGTKPTASSSTVQYGPVDYSQPSVYLDNLQLNSGDIKLDFKKDVSIYNVKVDSSIDQIDVTATPKESDSKVDVNGQKLKEDDNYRATLQNLTTGENTFTVKVTDTDGNSRKYNLNIYRGTDIASTTTTATTQVEANKWVQVSGRWQYNGKDGNPLRNQLFYDDNYKKTYYLNNEGFLGSGWQTIDRKYYYADSNGVVQKGWLNLGPNWYHLDVTTGEMNTGWFQDGDKWYYLDYSSGTMAHDTSIGQYKLGSDGAWIQ